MKHLIPFAALMLALVMTSGYKPTAYQESPEEPLPTMEVDSCLLLYSKLGLEGETSLEAFRQAYLGYQQIEGKRRELLTLIDFSKPSNVERLYVIDMAKEQLLYRSLVAHGRNSGELYATSFSNRPNSYQSSLGFYLTAETYQGGNGYSLRLDGLEKGINDNARSRAIVIHGAKYANPSVCQGGHCLGRSFGCPALPESLNRPIINAIKGGSVLFIYADNTHYLTASQLLKPVVEGDGYLG